MELIIDDSAPGVSFTSGFVLPWSFWHPIHFDANIPASVSAAITSTPRHMSPPPLRIYVRYRDKRRFQFPSKSTKTLPDRRQEFNRAPPKVSIPVFNDRWSRLSFGPVGHARKPGRNAQVCFVCWWQRDRTYEKEPNDHCNGGVNSEKAKQREYIPGEKREREGRGQGGRGRGSSP